MALSSKSSVLDLFHPQGSFKFPKHKFGTTERSFRAMWCKDYPWLHYDKASDSAFCHLCMRTVSEENFWQVLNVTLAVDIHTGRSHHCI